MSEHRIIGYARTSGERQELSLEEQQERIRARARQVKEAHEGAWAKCWTEQTSATKTAWRDRPVFKALCRDLHEGDILIVWRLNRIDRHPFRMISALDYFTQMGVRVIALELEFGGKGSKWELDLETSQGRFMTCLMAAMAEWWLDQMRDSVTAALRHLTEQGYYWGRYVGIGRKKVPVAIPGDGQTRSRRRYREIRVWDSEQCELIKEVWIRHNLFHEALPEIARDFWQRRERHTDGRPWVSRKPMGSGKKNQHKDVAPSQPSWRFTQDAIVRAAALIPELEAKGELPPELRISTETIRRIARRACSAEALAKAIAEHRKEEL